LSEVFAEHLDGDVSSHFGIMGEKDGAACALTEAAEDCVSVDLSGRHGVCTRFQDSID
jgi:hypothetical protein